MVIDCHSHIASRLVLPPRFFDGWVRTVNSQLGLRPSDPGAERIRTWLDQLTQDPDCTELIAEMDQAGIDRTMLLVIDFGIAFGESELTIEEIHLRHKSLRDSSQRFGAFSNVDPRRGAEGIDLFERAVRDWGFCGMKLYAPCGYSPSDPALGPFYEICSSRSLPVLTHVGPTASALPFGFSQPLGVDTAACNFPDVNFILGHAAVTCYQDAAMLAQFRPNVYLDLSSFQADVNRGEFQQIMLWHKSRGLLKKILFGTDWPIYRFWGSQYQWVTCIRELSNIGFSDEEIGDILGRNLASILPTYSSEAMTT